MVTCYLGVGSNLGNRRKNIQEAIALLNHTKGIQVKKVSQIYKTDPIGGPAQPKFLNGAISIQTSLPAIKLLKALKGIERKLGRIPSVRNGPRVIDLDILLYGKYRISSRELVVPHPRMLERNFVLRPLGDLIPSA